MEYIVFGGGCFWCIEAVFKRLKGVASFESGYTGGNIKNPSYREVCSGLTGHNEVVRVVFDESQISLEELMSVFFTVHDPTTLNRQGNDVGTQYRSGIYYKDATQKQRAEDFVMNEAVNYWSDPIVTEIEELDVFYPAEDYHQDYYDRNSQQGYCMMVINPKLQKLRENFKHLIKDE